MMQLNRGMQLLMYSTYAPTTVNKSTTLLPKMLAFFGVYCICTLYVHIIISLHAMYVARHTQRHTKLIRTCAACDRSVGKTTVSDSAFTLRQMEVCSWSLLLLSSALKSI